MTIVEKESNRVLFVTDDFSSDMREDEYCYYRNDSGIAYLKENVEKYNVSPQKLILYWSEDWRYTPEKGFWKMEPVPPEPSPEETIQQEYRNYLAMEVSKDGYN